MLAAVSETKQFLAIFCLYWSWYNCCDWEEC